jgi:hypothetical protein
LYIGTPYCALVKKPDTLFPGVPLFVHTPVTLHLGAPLKDRTN